jgi:hypothetical protein
VIVCGVVVDDDVDGIFGRHELLVAIARHAAAEDDAFEDVKRGKVVVVP